MTAPMTRANAATLTLATQIAAAAIGVGAIALGVTGLPDRAPPQVGTALPGTPGLAQPGQPTGGTVSPVSFAPIDTSGLAARLALLDNAPQITKAPDLAADRPLVEPNPAEDAYLTSIKGFAGRVRYLGMVQAGAERAAFVKVDGQQRIVRQGAVIQPPADQPDLEPLTIERVNGRAIVVTNGDARANINLEARTGPAITMVGGGDVAQAPGVEVAPTGPDLSVRMDGHEIREAEVARRNRNMERQAAGIRNTNPEAQLRMPEVRRVGGLGNRNRNTQPAQNDQANEQPEPQPRSDD